MVQKIQDIVEELKKSTLFNNIPQDSLAFIAQFCEIKQFISGQIIIECQNVSDGLYLITEGIVFVYSINESGSVTPLALIPAGEVCGEMGVLTKQNRCAYIEALSAVTCYFISKENFNKIINNIPKLLQNLISILSSRIRTENNYLENTKTKICRDRILTTLHYLAEYFPNGKITLTHERLADIVGITRPRLSEIIHDLVKNGIILNNHKTIQII